MTTAVDSFQQKEERKEIGEERKPKNGKRMKKKDVDEKKSVWLRKLAHFKAKDCNNETTIVQQRLQTQNKENQKSSKNNQAERRRERRSKKEWGMRERERLP
jgi:hypothetical protein